MSHANNEAAMRAVQPKPTYLIDASQEAFMLDAFSHVGIREHHG